MYTFRKLIGLIVVAFAAAGLALPALAQQNPKRQYSLTMATTPATAPVTINMNATTTVSATFTNLTQDNGISTIRSLKLSVPSTTPAGSISIVNGSVTLGSYSSTLITYGGTWVTIDGINPPVKNPLSITVTFSVTTTCQWAGGAWTADVYTGTPQTGNMFNQQKPVTGVDTGFSGTCALAITPTANPTGAAAVPTCAAYSVLPGGSTTCAAAAANPGFSFTGWTGCDSYVAPSTTCSLNNVTIARSPVANYAIDVTGAVSPAGYGTMICTSPVASGGTSTCTATGTAGTSYVATSFTTSVAGTTCTANGSPTPPATPAGSWTSTCTTSAITAPTQVTASFASGSVACAPGSNKVYSDPIYDPNADSTYQTGTAGWGGARGANTAAGCEKIDVNVDQGTQSATIKYPKDIGRTPTFKFVFVWAPTALDLNGYSAKRPYVAYGTPPSPPPSPANSEGFSVIPSIAGGWMPALMCTDDPDPDAMSTMSPAELAALLPLIPNVEPYNGYTGGVANGLLDQYKATVDGSGNPTKKALACVSQVGVSSFNGQAQHFHKLIDEVDLGFGYGD